MLYTLHEGTAEAHSPPLLGEHVGRRPLPSEVGKAGPEIGPDSPSVAQLLPTGMAAHRDSGR